MTIKEDIKNGFLQSWNHGDLSSIKKLYAANYVNNENSGMPPVVNRDALSKQVTMYRTAFPNIKMEVPLVLQTGDFVVLRWTCRGKNTEKFMGQAATNKNVTVSGTVIHRIKDSQIAESWNSWDSLSFLQQLGMAPDTTKRAELA